MATTERTKKAITPPKGRPTPSRSGYRRKRTFGSTFQWAALAVLGVVLFVIVLILLDGGDFNPFNDDAAMVVRTLTSVASGGRVT